MSRERLLLIGWDSADWMSISPLLDSGAMPNLASLVERGVMGNLASASPCLSPMLWTTIATGKSADVHGISGFVEVTPGGRGVRAARGSSRRCAALWNMFESRGMESVVVDWPVSHPAERVTGRFVSDLHYGVPPGDLSGIWPIVDDSVWPDKQNGSMASLRVSPAELGPGDLAAWIPSLPWYQADALDPRPGILAEVIARDATGTAQFADALAGGTWRFGALCLHGLDTAGHVFMPYHPPRLPHVPIVDFEIYRGVMSAMYRYYDQILGTLLGFVDEDVTIVLVSDHGFCCDHRRPADLPMTAAPAAGAAAWHRGYGIFVMAGPGVRRDERIYGAAIFDVAPTVLYAMDLPVGHDMIGKPLVQAWSAAKPVESIASWETECGFESRYATQGKDCAETDDPAFFERLVDLGYLPQGFAHAGAGAANGPVAETDARIALVRAESRFNLALVHLHHGRPRVAVEILKTLAVGPDAPGRYVRALAHASIRAGSFDDVVELVRVLESRGESGVEIDLLASQASLSRGDIEEGERRLARALAMAPNRAGVQRCAGQRRAEQGLWEEAIDHFRAALRLDPEDLTSQIGLSRALSQLKRFEESLESAMDLLSQLHFHPEAHFLAGKAWAGLGDAARAIRSLELALSQQPGYSAARVLLMDLYRQNRSWAKPISPL